MYINNFINIIFISYRRNVLRGPESFDFVCVSFMLSWVAFESFVPQVCGCTSRLGVEKEQKGTRKKIFSKKV